MKDQVILVNELDEPVGVMDKIEAHRGLAKLHRAVSVFLFNHKQEVLLQQRSAKKIVGAGQWANTCCGNVRPGESYEECAHRRLREELGISNVTLIPIQKFSYFAKCNEEFSEREMDQVFVGYYSGQMVPNPDEVSASAWVGWTDFLAEVTGDKKEARNLAPWLSEMHIQGLLRKVGRKEMYAIN